jgi:hypothetical protein
MVTAQRAVVPLYGPRGKRVPVHGGCGVLVNLGESLFVLTASHVHASLDAHASGQFLVAISDRFVPLEGRCYRTNSNDSAEDKFDAAILEVEPGEGADLLLPLAFQLTPLDIRTTERTDEYVVFGYPHRDAGKTTGGTVVPRSYWWHGVAVSASQRIELGLDPEPSIAMELHLKSIVSDQGELRESLSPRGASGSGMWAIDGAAPARLEGIFVELRGNYFVATSIRAHLTLIAHYNPGVFNRWWNDPRRFV